jgi:hypothetical protein
MNRLLQKLPDWVGWLVCIAAFSPLSILVACEYRPYGELEGRCHAAGGVMVRSHTTNAPTCVKPIILQQP